VHIHWWEVQVADRDSKFDEGLKTEGEVEGVWKSDSEGLDGIISDGTETEPNLVAAHKFTGHSKWVQNEETVVSEEAN
jgi:hypothetical protein